VASPPDKTDYFTGEDLDLEGLVVRGTWDGLGEKPVVITQGNLSSFDKNRAGKQEVFITYLGKTASFPVTFVSMQAISITRPPAKLNYENGEELNLAGMTVQGTRTGAASIELVDVSRLKISGYDRFKGGNQVVTVTIGGRSAAFRVTVAPNPFVGTWQGTKIDTFGKGHAIPVTFIMTEDSWSMSFETEEYIGTYTRDNDSGKRAALLPGKSGYSGSTAPEAAEILSPTALKLTGGTFGRDGLILEKVR
ncbi:MAG: bacterial Ig-like domain-containing protein, partial [Treponema sp.]|jgi:hypothetical protein|nr:bacterial Ig-like domain-containing protein [Treponema sp.]